MFDILTKTIKKQDYDLSPVHENENINFPSVVFRDTCLAIVYLNKKFYCAKWCDSLGEAYTYFEGVEKSVDIVMEKIGTSNVKRYNPHFD